MYADAFQIYLNLNMKQFDKIMNLVNSDIDNIVLLTNNHELKPNPNKTKLIIIAPITN